MANAQFLRQLQFLSMPILAVSTFNGSPELASLLSLRAVLTLVLKTSRFYARVVPAVAADVMAGEAERDEEIERIAQSGRVPRVDILEGLRQPLVGCSHRSCRVAATPLRRRQRRRDGGGSESRPQEGLGNSWTLRRRQ